MRDLVTRFFEDFPTLSPFIRHSYNASHKLSGETKKEEQSIMENFSLFNS